MKRRTAREKAIQALFQIDRSQTDPDEAIANVLDEEQEVDEFLEKLVQGTVEHLLEIDEKLKQHLENWSLERIGNVDRAILRLATFEMEYLDDVPVNVTMNEAIELAKVFGDDNSSRFVNGVLSKMK